MVGEGIAATARGRSLGLHFGLHLGGGSGRQQCGHRSQYASGAGTGKQRAALQVNDYVEIMLSKLNVAKEGTRSLADTVADTREILIGVEQEDEGREQRHEARVVV